MQAANATAVAAAAAAAAAAATALAAAQQQAQLFHGRVAEFTAIVARHTAIEAAADKDEAVLVDAARAEDNNHAAAVYHAIAAREKGAHVEAARVKAALLAKVARAVEAKRVETAYQAETLHLTRGAAPAPAR